MTFPLDVRQLFLNLPEEAAHIATTPPEWRHVFTPRDHEGALSPHRTVVIGDRGTGKSFWSSVLVDPQTLGLVAKRYPKLKLERVYAKLAFSEGQMKADHPSPTEIADLIGTGADAEDIWRAVALSFAPCPPDGMPDYGTGNWRPVVDWVRADPARRNGSFRQINERLVGAGQTYVLVFDALDVIADDWHAIRLQMRGLIRLALALRALSAIRLKWFIRPDMADDQGLWAVGDASKLRHDQVSLVWRRTDLYGLLWTLLSNPANVELDESACRFRTTCATLLGREFEFNEDRWAVPHDLAEDEASQRGVFHSLAGEYMGGGPKRGDTYKWVPNHLADAAGYAAPRSFLLAMRQAARRAEADNATLVLDRAGLEAGARTASATRVDELAEDYRWMSTVLKAMDSLTVPILESDLTTRWRERDTIQSLKREAQEKSDDHRSIPPGNVLETTDDDEARARLVEQMVRLRIFFRLSDNRINMPDLFRLRANVKRKGGMKPRI